jgi:hypothetical protein
VDVLLPIGDQLILASWQADNSVKAHQNDSKNEEKLIA